MALLTLAESSPLDLTPFHFAMAGNSFVMTSETEVAEVIQRTVDRGASAVTNKLGEN